MSTATTGELVLVDASNAVALFEGGLDAVLHQIEQEVRAHAPDISTDKGRKAIASLAYKVAKSKTALDDLGKNLVADWKQKAAAVDVERKRLRDRLDALKEEVRRPLTEWEDAEKRRIAEHEETLENIFDIGETNARNWQTLAIESMRSSLSFLRGISRDWQEFAVRAERAIGVAVQQVSDAIDRREKHDAEQAELARLRAEAAERARKDREEQIAREAAEKARKEAEDKARREREVVARKQKAEAEAAERERLRVEQEKAEAIRRAEMAEKAIALAKKQAEEERARAAEAARRQAEEAAARERQRVEAEQARAKAAQEKADAAAARRKAVREAITDDLKEFVGCGHDVAVEVVSAIARGQISYVQITTIERKVSQ